MTSSSVVKELIVDYYISAINEAIPSRLRIMIISFQVLWINGKFAPGGILVLCRKFAKGLLFLFLFIYLFTYLFIFEIQFFISNRFLSILPSDSNLLNNFRFSILFHYETIKTTD